MRQALLISTVLVIVCAGAFADDLHPPIWRGEEGTTLQAWEFDDDDNPALAEYDANENGTPLVTIEGAYPSTRWKATDLGETGVWVTEELVQLDLPNYPVPNDLKLIRLQMTWWADVTPELVFLPMESAVELVYEELLLSGYTHSTYDITLEPNPEFETIYILPRNCTLYLSQLVVDTWCVPEPTSLLVLVGGLALIRRRRN